MSLQLLSELYRVGRLYINFFQPSVKLSNKERDGGNVKRIYDVAATPCQRLVENAHVLEVTKKSLNQLFDTLDPMALLTEMERLQGEFWSTAIPNNDKDKLDVLTKFIKAAKPEQPKTHASPPKPRRLKIAKEKQAWTPAAPYPGNKKGKKSNLDEVWEEVCRELSIRPMMTPRQVLALLEARYPNRFRKTQLNTINDKLKAWRFKNSLPIEFEKLKPGKKSNVNEVWELALEILEHKPNLSCNALLKLLIENHPDKVNQGKRTSIYERLRIWRIENMPPLNNAPLEINNITIFEEALSVVSEIEHNE
ncbi:MAG: hypothetical protein K2X81_16615 [Candidatus Obscuribacterales bacterium]|nr:hypothetical protein [Candidatus Obscuribacterales bacterium]